MTHTVHKLKNQCGAVLLMILVSVTLFGLMAGIAGTSWQTMMQRHKENELLWRGTQIRKAIDSYYNFKPSETVAIKQFPSSLNDLIKDPRILTPIKHLRKLYSDPVAGADWILIMAPGGGIMGVHSSSEAMPFKRYGFSEDNKLFNGQLRYIDWTFQYIPTKTNTKKKLESKVEIKNKTEL
jgi:type II secretory pathway pseudopilin PulG